MASTGRARLIRACRPLPAPSPAPPGVVLGSLPSREETARGPVPPKHNGRSYEGAKGQYLIVEDAELEAIEIESTHTIEIDRFVPHSAIDQRFFDSPYYVMPSEPVGQEAFAVIREAMR